jgi:hypothetical protein
LDTNGNHTGKNPCTYPTHRKSKEPSQDREDETLRQELPQNPTSTGPKSSTKPKFTPARPGPNKHQAGEIDTSEEHDEEHRPEEGQQCRSDRTRHLIV